MPPPTPAVAATSSRTPNDVSGLRRPPRPGRRRGSAAAARRRPSSCGRRTGAPRTCRGAAASRRPGSGRRPARTAGPASSAKPAVPSLSDDDAPQRPDGEAEVLGEDREDRGCGGRSGGPSPPRTSGPRGPSGRSSGRSGGRAGGRRGQGEGGIHLERRDQARARGQTCVLVLGGPERALGRPGKRGNAKFPRPAVAVKRPSQFPHKGCRRRREDSAVTPATGRIGRTGRTGAPESGHPLSGFGQRGASGGGRAGRRRAVRSPSARHGGSDRCASAMQPPRVATNPTAATTG